MTYDPIGADVGDRARQQISLAVPTQTPSAKVTQVTEASAVPQTSCCDLTKLLTFFFKACVLLLGLGCGWGCGDHPFATQDQNMENIGELSGMSFAKMLFPNAN